MPERLARVLGETIDRELPRLREIRDEAAGLRREDGGWSRKEELGHLLDSAANNRVRFVRAALEPEYAGPTYDGDGWVRLHGYNDLPWSTLLDVWERDNRLLAHLVGRIPDDKLATQCSIAGRPAVTLEFLIEDYVHHMQHHLDHILRH